MSHAKRPSIFKFREYMIAGLLTLIPVTVTFFIIKFVYDLLGSIARPLVTLFADQLGDDWPQLNVLLHNPVVQTIAFLLCLLLLLYVLGVLTAHVVGRRAMSLFDRIMTRIPFIESVYGSTKKFVDVLKNKPSGSMKRVVLVNFPNRHMKAIGFVTRTLKDATTGRELAAVYIPTTPNPTSGYMELMPVEDVIPTDWSMDEAMTYIISGGTVAPETVHFEGPALPPKG